MNSRRLHGYTLIPMLMTMLAITSSMLGISKWMRSMGNSGRVIASDLTQGDIAILFHHLTDSADVCAQTGLIGTSLTSLLGPSPTPVPVTINFPVTAGASPVPAIQAGMIFSNVRKVDSLKVTTLTHLGAAGSPLYLATVKLKTELTGTGTSMKNPEQSFHLGVTVGGAGNQITGCSGLPIPSGTPSATVANCPSGEIATGIDFGLQTITCKKPQYGGSYSWLGGSWPGYPYTQRGVGGGAPPTPAADPEDFYLPPSIGSPQFSTCIYGNPNFGAQCGCPVGYLHKQVLGVQFANNAGVNIGGNFGCTANNGLGQFCSLNITQCILP